MKRLLALLMTCSLCIACLGLSCVAVAGEYDHAAHEHDLMLDEPVSTSAQTTTLYTDLKDYSYNEAAKTLTITISIGTTPLTATPVNLKGGYLEIKAPYNSLLRLPSVSYGSNIFGQLVNTTSPTVTIGYLGDKSTIRLTVPDGSSTNPAKGEITLVYPIDPQYLTYNWMREVNLELSAALTTADDKPLLMDSFSGTITVYACTHAQRTTAVVTPATCKSEGLNREYCLLCNYTISTSKTLPTDHNVDFSKPIIQPTVGYTYTEPSCELPGYGYFKCNTCGTITGTSIPATGHTLGERFLDNGVYKQRCTKCNYIGFAKNQCSHDASLYTLKQITKNPTCSVAGTGVYECPTCKQTDERSIPTIAHTYGDWLTLKSATCTEKGARTHTCTVCEFVETQEVGMLEHSYGAWRTLKASTCISDGQRSRTCSVCQFEDVEIMEKSGHSYGAWTVIENPTCVKIGVQRQVCALCNDVQTQNIPMTDHTYGSWMVTLKPTCTSVGEETKVCSVCGGNEKREIAMDETAHSWGDWKSVSTKTCITNGTKERKCTLCNVEDVAVDPAVGHEFGATTVKGKVSTTTCAVCGFEEIVKTVKGGVEKTLSDVSGTLVLSGDVAAKAVSFELSGMSIENLSYYNEYVPADKKFDKAYVLKFLVDGTPASITSDMEMTLSIDKSLEDYDVDLVILRGDSFYTLSDYDRKGTELTIAGSALTGAEAIFVVKGAEQKANLALPIIISVLTISIAGAAVYFIMSKGKNKGVMF